MKLGENIHLMSALCFWNVSLIRSKLWIFLLIAKFLASANNFGTPSISDWQGKCFFDCHNTGHCSTDLIIYHDSKFPEKMTIMTFFNLPNSKYVPQLFLSLITTYY